MEVLMAKTERSPSITLNGNELTIEGRSFMDNAVEFYRNIIARLKSLTFKKLDVIVHLNYFNTSSSKCLLELFHTFEKMNREGNKVSIFWYYAKDSQDLEEAGEDYRDLVTDLPFELVEIDE